MHQGRHAAAVEGLHTPTAHTPRPRCQFVRRLPLRGDALDAMSDAAKAAWAADPKLTVGETLRALAAAATTITVDVKLVGFDGDGCGGGEGAKGGGREGAEPPGQHGGSCWHVQPRAGNDCGRPGLYAPVLLA